MRFVKKIKYLIILTMDFFVGVGISTAPKSGLVLIRLDSIGDFVIWLDSAEKYRKIYRDKRITLIANDQWVGLAEKFPYWDDVWPLDVGRFVNDIFFRFSFLRQIRRANFEVAISPPYSRVLFLGDSLIRSTCASVRIGSTGDSSNLAHKKLSNKWYTKLLPVAPAPMMELYRNAEFIKNLGFPEHIAAIPCIPPLRGVSVVDRVSDGYFIIFPGASWVGRQWPVERFASVLISIAERYGWVPVLLGGVYDVDLCYAIEKDVSIHCINLAGKTDLIDLVEIIRGAQILISNETSAVHFATAVSTPSVCILGGGHYGRFVPYPEDLSGTKPVAAVESMSCFNCNWQCIKRYDVSGPVPCIDAVSVHKVLSSVNCALEQSFLLR